MSPKSEVTPEQVHSCIACGSCCRNFSFVQLTPSDVNRLEVSTNTSREAFFNSHECGSNIGFMKFKDNGDCIFLNVEEGVYSCGVYEARSEVCRAYPKSNIQEHRCCNNSNRKS
ncbi:MAG: YkgJ family cysteine cluster protein [Planctomycetota bacterium]